MFELLLPAQLPPNLQNPGVRAVQLSAVDRECLNGRIAKDERAANPTNPRKVVGVYIAWPGLSADVEALETLSFYSRKNAGDTEPWTPFYVVRVDKALMDGHNDIWEPNFTQFLEAFIAHTDKKKAGEASHRVMRATKAPDAAGAKQGP